MNGSVERANWSHSFSRQSSIVRTPTHTRSQTHKNKTEKDITANKKEHKLSSSFLGYSFSKRAHKKQNVDNNKGRTPVAVSRSLTVGAETRNFLRL